MATYIPNATQTTEPVESRTVESAALEFRTLKTSINARIAAEEAARIAADSALQATDVTQDVRLTAIENALLSIGEGGLPGTVYVQRFSGTGAQTAFTLNAAPQSGNAVDIYVNGLYQNKDTFSVAGAVITFSAAPPAGTNNIEVQVTVTIALGETDASLVTYNTTTVEAQLDSVEAQLDAISAASGSSLVGFQQAGSGAVVRTAQDKLREWVSVEDFLPSGINTTTANCAPYIQAATDYAESVKAKLQFDGSKTYLIASTLYVGNAIWETNGATFSIVSDSAFSQVGTATRRAEGCVLTKSASSAGYGLTTVSFIFDVLRYTFSRPTAGVGPKTAFLLESVDGLYGDLIDAATATGQNTAKCLLDFYSAVRNVNISAIKMFCRNGTSAEGFWIRNAATTSATENIQIDLLDIDHEGVDEALAIYAFNLVGGAPDVRNVNIDVCKVKAVYGNGVSFIDISGAAYSTDRFKNIRIGRLDLSMTSGRGSPFGVKAEKYAPMIDELNITVSDLTGATGSVVLLRSVADANQKEKFRVGEARIRLGDVPDSGTVWAIDGELDIGAAYTETFGAGAYSVIARNGCTIQKGELGGTVTGQAAFAVKEIGRDVNVYGKTEGVENLFGTVHVNTDQFSGAVWMQYSAVSGGMAVGVKIDAKVKITGAGTISRILNASGSLSSTKPVDVRLRIENLVDKTIPADGVSGSYALTSYDNVQVKTTGPSRITLTLTV